jgi:HEAT repeat protein
LENSKENQELIYANAALNGIGTKKSLPYLERMLKSRNQDVKGTAKSAIEKINERGS